ncbi:MAG: HAD-IIA family hydrolase [Candidatus Aenigmatarchaeota archaeon]
MINPRFENFKNFMFDLDGTIWKWTCLIPGAKKVVEELYANGKTVHFITNNTALSRAGFVAKLKGFGIRTTVDQIINPSVPAARILKGKRVFLLAEGIRKDLLSAGVKITGSRPQAVLIGEDRTINYDKLVTATTAVNSGAHLYKTAAGGRWLMGDKQWPGTGAIAAAIEMATGRVAELIGKPSRHMLQDMRRIGYKASETVIIGDETLTDIEAGNLLGWKTALVLTGNSNGRDAILAHGYNKPQFVLSSVAELLKR